MFVWLATLALAADPVAADWQRPEADHLHNIRQITFDFVPRGRGLFLTRRQANHLPGRGKRQRQSILSDLRSGPGHRPLSPRQPRRRQNDLLATSRPDGKKIIFASSPISIPKREATLRRRNIASETKIKRRASPPPLPVGFRQAHGHLRGQPGRHRSETADRFARATTPKGHYSPDGKQIVFCSNRSGPATCNCASWTPTARTSPPTDDGQGLLQRRPVLLAGRQAGDFPQRPQREGSTCNFTSSTPTARASMP